MVKVYVPNNIVSCNSVGNFLKIDNNFIPYYCYMVEYNKKLDSVDFYYFSFELLKKHKTLVIKKIIELINNNNKCLNDYLSVFSFFSDIKYYIKDYDNTHIIYVCDDKNNYKID